MYVGSLGIILESSRFTGRSFDPVRIRVGRIPFG